MPHPVGNIGLVARRINNWIPGLRGPSFASVDGTVVNYDQGLVLLAGVTGSGKTTDDRPAMLNYINHKYRKQTFLTLEDPSNSSTRKTNA